MWILGVLRSTFRGIWLSIKHANSLIIVLFLVASLSLNVATVAFSSVAALVSGVYETVTGLKSVSSSLRNKVVVQDGKIRRLTAEVGTKNRRIAKLTDEVGHLRASRFVNFRGRRVAVSEIVEQTTKRMSRRVRKMAIRDVSSTFGEAVPIIGVAVISGVTTLEIYDACQTMKDLKDLNLAFNPDSAIEEDEREVCGMHVPTRDEIWEKVKASPSAAWESAKSYVPDLPEFSMPSLSALAFWR